MLADTKLLISKIKAAHDMSKQTWLWVKDIDVGDKRANLGLMLYGNISIKYSGIIELMYLEMCETYDAMDLENKFEIECAPNLGKIMNFNYFEVKCFC